MCVCKKTVKEEIPNQFMFELESNIASGQDGNGDRVTICPRCFLIYSDGGKDQKRKNFLKMVYEVSTYLLVMLPSLLFGEPSFSNSKNEPKQAYKLVKFTNST